MADHSPEAGGNSRTSSMAGYRVGYVQPAYCSSTPSTTGNPNWRQPQMRQEAPNNERSQVLDAGDDSNTQVASEITREQHRAILLSAPAVEVEHNAYSLNVDQALKAVLALTFPDDNLVVQYKSVEEVKLLLGLFGSTLLINHIILMEELGYTRLKSPQGNIVGNSNCQLVATRLFGELLKDRAFSPSVLQSDYDLSKDMEGCKKITEMPFMIHAQPGWMSDELKVFWASSATQTRKKVLALAASKTDYVQSKSTKRTHVTKLRNAECGCPEKTLVHKTNQAKFCGLDYEENYFPMVSRSDSVAFFGVSPASLMPRSADARRLSDKAAHSSKSTELPAAASIPKLPESKVSRFSQKEQAHRVAGANKLPSALYDGEEEQMRSMWELTSAPYRAKIDAQTTLIVERDAIISMLKLDIESRKKLSLSDSREITTLKADMEASAQQVMVRDAEIRKLKTEHNEMNEKADKTFGKNHGTIVQMEGENRVLESDLRNAVYSKQDFQDRLATTQNNLKAMERSRENVRLQTVSLEGDLRVMERSRGSLQAQLLTAQEIAQSEIELSMAMKSDLDKIKVEKQAAEQKLVNLEQRLLDNSKQLSIKKEQVENHPPSNVTDNNIDSLRLDVKNLEDEIMDLSAENCALNQKLEEEKELSRCQTRKLAAYEEAEISVIPRSSATKKRIRTSNGHSSSSSIKCDRSSHGEGSAQSTSKRLRLGGDVTVKQEGVGDSVEAVLGVKNGSPQFSIDLTGVN